MASAVGSAVREVGTRPPITRTDLITNTVCGQLKYVVVSAASIGVLTLGNIFINTIVAFKVQKTFKAKLLANVHSRLCIIGGVFSTVLSNALCLTNKKCFDSTFESFKKKAEPDSVFEYLNLSSHNDGFVSGNELSFALFIQLTTLQSKRGFLRKQVASRIVAVSYLVDRVVMRAIDAAISVPLAVVALIANGFFKCDKFNKAALGAAGWLNIMADVHYVVLSLFRPGLAFEMLTQHVDDMGAKKGVLLDSEKTKPVAQL